MSRCFETAVIALVAGSAGAWIAAPQDPPKKLTASSLELVGADGKPRAMWRVKDSGAPELILTNPDGSKPQLVVECGASGPSAIFFDKEGRPRASMGAGAAFRIDANDAAGNRRVRLEVPAEGAATIEIFDAEKKSLWKAP